MPVERTTSRRPSLQPRFSASPRKHTAYYMPDGNVVIRVQNTLFKLDLHVLHEKSPVLRTIMPPVYHGKTLLLGFNDESPFVLHEDSEVDFERLLWILFPGNSPICKATTVEEWLSILKLARKYQIEGIRELAAQHLQAMSIDPVRKITIWDAHQLDPAMLTSAYVELCKRVEPLTLDMTMALGIKKFTKVAAARDLYRQRIMACKCKRRSTKERQAVAEDIVSKLFTPLKSVALMEHSS